jgi:hypothetical protein
MQCSILLRQVLQDEAMTRGLGDAEAKMLFQWVTDWTELLIEMAPEESQAAPAVQALCRKARAIGKFVSLWTWRDQRGAACQLAATERFTWPLPDDRLDPELVMERILQWEDHHLIA